MKIHSIESIIVDIPLIRPHKLAMATIMTQRNVIVRVRSTDDVEGIGEAASIPHYGAETAETIKTVIDTVLAPGLVGKEVKSLETLTALKGKLIKGNPYAKAAVDIACADMLARSLGIPISRLFGGQVHERLPVLWVLGTGDADRDIEEAKAKLDDRLHRTFLVKIGAGDPVEDVARAARVVKALGDRAEIRVDVNQCWDEPTAVRGIAGLLDAGISIIEQPVARTNRAAMRRLSERFECLIIADEPIETPEDALQYAAERSCGAFSIKVGKHGGLGVTKKVVAIAEAAGLQMFGGTMLEGSIGVAAHSQLFSTIGRMSLGTQLFGPLLLRDDVVQTPVRFENFGLVVPTDPGIGVSIDEDKLAHYRLR
jgi:muconate cycloisomerase